MILLGRLLLQHSANLGRHLGRQSATSSAKWFQTNAVKTIVTTQSIEINGYHSETQTKHIGLIIRL